MKQRITIESEDKQEKLTVEYDVKVNASGIFTTTLKPEDAEKIQSYGVVIHSNGRRGSRAGYFESETFAGMALVVSNLLKECLSRTLIKSEIVLRYSIETMASFGLTTNNVIIPNLAYCEDGRPDLNKHWQGGTVSIHAATPSPMGILFYIKPFIKNTYQYKSGKSRVEYISSSAFGNGAAQYEGDEYKYLRWLISIPVIAPPREGKLMEIEYNEERAKFFVDLFKSICTMAYKVTQFIEPEKMIELIESKGTLILDK